MERVRIAAESARGMITWQKSKVELLYCTCNREGGNPSNPPAVRLEWQHLALIIRDYLSDSDEALEKIKELEKRVTEYGK